MWPNVKNKSKYNEVSNPDFSLLFKTFFNVNHSKIVAPITNKSGKTISSKTKICKLFEYKNMTGKIANKIV